ncbi:hypothetical protein R1sor_009848 [Riccia sorocarpa]|uniref:Uncharacterized protein n=1 Tax=Riccia sorocarpa TaxID=122646 RepID=A0ABD3HZW2_9MARC
MNSRFTNVQDLQPFDDEDMEGISDVILFGPIVLEFPLNQTLRIPEGTELVGKRGYALDHQDEDDRNQKVFLKIPAVRFVAFPDGTSIRMRDSLFYITMFSGTTMCSPHFAQEIVEGKRFENSLRANFDEWKLQHWEAVLGPSRGIPGGHTFDTKFKINNANRARIANKFAAKKSKTNGFPVQFLKDPFERTVAITIMALFRPYRTTYMTAHQVVLLEHMLSPTGRVDWAEIFHNFVRDSMNFCLGDDSGTHYFSVFVGHFYIGLNLLDDEERKYMKSHYPTEEKLKDVVWMRRQKAMEDRIRVFAET